MNLESLSISALGALNEACDAFEEAWKPGQRPQIEEYLPRAKTDQECGALFRMLLEVELELRTKACERPSAQEYVERFPPFSEIIRSVFNHARSGATEPVSLLTTEPGPADLHHRAVGETTVSPPPAPPPRPEMTGNGVQPERIGRYPVDRLVAEGNFLVYLARDPSSDRQVAIKIARPGDSEARRRIMSLADEAKKLQGLNHPRIVRLYEYVPGDGPGAAHDGFIVLEYVAGQTLEDLLKAGRPSPHYLARIVTLVADAVHHAHTHQTGLVHRDLKPSNILLDQEGDPHVCDFGLAVDEQVQRLRRREVAGTLPYMAPEQVRGETHRLDGRTDIWALGVILYRGLTGKLPFPGRNADEVFDEILNREPKPLRMHEPGVDAELERICLRCLSRPMGERYLTAADLAADLERWLAGERSLGGSVAPRIAPKGLLSFDVEDAGFFLTLLPGPRRGDGLPESVRFWKDRVEALEGNRAFCVGLLYGPSGGGKSSFIKAGLLPHLDKNRVRAVYVEATPSGTEARLEAELHRIAPSLPEDADLADLVAILRDDARRRPAAKLFLVLDQFEQWLEAHPDKPDGVLVRALRQCDGRGVQALLLVRDDFWMAVSRFLRAVDVPLVQGGNAAAVELFDARHARKVLEEFGRALGRLPSETERPDAEASQFLDEVVKGLTVGDERVIPARLSLFTEVVRHRPWTPATLEKLGGLDGIGVKFLEDRFESNASPHRVHKDAAAAVLQTLLPPAGAVIRGAVRTRSELLSASGYSESSGEFAELMRALDHELRLVAATDPPAPAGQPGGAQTTEKTPGEICYQLAHDYLIRPVRQWREKERGATPAGRARLRLELVTAAWRERPGPRQLPSLLEWLGILRHVRPRDRSPDEQHLMRATARYYASRFMVVAALVICLAVATEMLRSRETALSLRNQAISASDRRLRDLMPELERSRALLIPKLEAIVGTVPKQDRRHERDVASVLLYRFAPTPPRGQILRDLLFAAMGPDRVELITDALCLHHEHSGTARLWDHLRDQSADPGRRLRAAAALARLDPNHPGWKGAGRIVARALLHEDRATIPRWIELFRNVLPHVVPQLHKDVADNELDLSARTVLAQALAEALILDGSDAAFAGPICQASSGAFSVLLGGLQRLGRIDGAIEALGAILNDPGTDANPELRASRQANAAIALLILGHPEPLWPRLQHAADPRLRSLIIDRLGRFDVGALPLLGHLQAAVDPVELQGVLMALAEIKTRRETGLDRLPPAAVSTLLNTACQLYREDSHPGVHSAAELVLRRWQKADDVADCDGQLRDQPRPPALRLWELGPNGHTMVILKGPLEFRMGSPADEDGRYVHENEHFVRIDRSIEVSTKEVTIRQYRQFKSEFRQETRYALELDCPANNADWSDAARYCNWLSEQAKIPRSQWCYPTDLQAGTVVAADSIERCGYRLPTEAEWEYFCRAATDTARPFGASGELMSRYAWTWLNSKDLTHPVGQLLPNEFGLFDILGNVWEWCHDGPMNSDRTKYPPYPSGTRERPAADRGASLVFEPEKTYRLLRGGAFDYAPGQARSAHRYSVGATHVEGTIGFRVVRTLPREQTKP